MATPWRLFVYRKVSKVDILAAEAGNPGLKRFEALSGEEAQMRSYFQDFAQDPQVLAVELIDQNGYVAARKDGLLDRVRELRAASKSGPAGDLKGTWLDWQLHPLWEAMIGPDVKMGG